MAPPVGDSFTWCKKHLFHIHSLGVCAIALLQRGRYCVSLALTHLFLIPAAASCFNDDMMIRVWRSKTVSEESCLNAAARVHLLRLLIISKFDYFDLFSCCWHLQCELPDLLAVSVWDYHVMLWTVFTDHETQPDLSHVFIDSTFWFVFLLDSELLIKLAAHQFWTAH